MFLMFTFAILALGYGLHARHNVTKIRNWIAAHPDENETRSQQSDWFERSLRSQQEFVWCMGIAGFFVVLGLTLFARF
jgi:hypothetical protein